MFLFILEGLGTSELLLILIVALVIFGPRKLPQLSRSIGKSLANFKRASEDFKQTWEKEVAREGAIKEAFSYETTLPAEDRSILGEPRSRTEAVLESAETETPSHQGTVVARSSSAPVNDSQPDATAAQSDTARAPEVSQTRKRDWL